MADSMHSELDQLRRENARLLGLLEAQGIAWRSSGTLAVDFDQQDWRDDARAGASILPTNTITTPMALRDGATANGSCAAVTDGPPLLGRLNLGLQLYKGNAIEARAE